MEWNEEKNKKLEQLLQQQLEHENIAKIFEMPLEKLNKHIENIMNPNTPKVPTAREFKPATETEHEQWLTGFSTAKILIDDKNVAFKEY